MSIETETNRKFRAAMRSKMEKRKLSQRDVADRLGTSTSYVNRVLQGKMRCSLDQAERFAAAVGLKLRSLLR